MAAAACDSPHADPGDPDAAVAIDAADALVIDAIPIDAGPANATVRIQSTTTFPLAGERVMVSAADGSFRGTTLTGADGVAAVHVEPGDLITYLEGAEQIVFGGVQPGDAIVFDVQRHAQPFTATAHITLEPITVGSGTVWVTSDCESALRHDADPIELRSCRTDGHLDAEAVAVDFMQRELAYATVTGVADGGTASAGTWHPAHTQHLSVTVDHVQPDALMLIAEIYRSGPIGLPRRELGSAQMPSVGAFPRTFDLPYDDAPAAGTRLAVFERKDAVAGIPGRIRRATLPTVTGTPPATASIDVAAVLPPPISDIAVSLPAAHRPRVEWIGNAGDTDGFVELTLRSGTAATGETVWRAYLPAGTTSFQLPAVPVDVASVRDLDVIQLQAEVTAFVQTDLSWDQARQRPYDRFDMPGPTARRTVSTLTTR